MKTLAKTLGAMLLVIALLAVYLIWGARLSVSVTNEYVVPASEMADEFESAMERISSGEIEDKCWFRPVSMDIEDYSFVVMEVTARSRGMLPCEWITAGITPLEGDHVLVSDRLDDIGAFGSSTGRILLLSDASTASTGHSLWLNYYAFGIKTCAEASGRS